jgi:hypothetical protein
MAHLQTEIIYMVHITSLVTFHDFCGNSYVLTCKHMITSGIDTQGQYLLHMYFNSLGRNSTVHSAT